MKRCGGCREEKSSGAFYKNTSQKDGLNRICKACYAAYSAAWRKASREL